MLAEGVEKLVLKINDCKVIADGDVVVCDEEGDLDPQAFVLEVAGGVCSMQAERVLVE